MREFTVIFRSVQELSEFMALANQQPFDVLFVRAGGVSNAKSMFSCLSLQLNSPQMVRILADGVDVSRKSQRRRPFGVLPEYAAVSGAVRDGLKR